MELAEPTKSIALNQGQKAVAESFMQFLFGKEKELCISGPGGVGKTFLMAHLIDEVMPQYQKMCDMMAVKAEYVEVVMTATTNKAAEVLAEATKRPTQTIHSFLGLVLKEDWSTGKMKLSQGKGWHIHHNKIIFIDEASMIDTPLRREILEGTHHCKIIYVGDASQLAPIMEPLSPVYADTRLPFFELLEPMRTSIPELQAVNAQIRKTVKTGVFNPIQAHPGIIDWLDGPQMEAEVNRTFAGQTHEARILAYTNPRVLQYNSHIRDLRGLGADFTVGEFLVNNSAVIMSSNMMHVEEEVEIKSIESSHEMIDLDGHAQLEVVRMDLQNRYNEVYRDVPVPVDRDHYDRLLKYFKQQKLWRTFYQLKNGFPDLRQRDAATVHKAQGSTYETVFIDLEDLSTCRNPETAARLLYVAFSRARRRVVCYGELAEKFGGMTY
ncbi:AAA family ATPase [Caballeronia sp. LZ034LL]|uniref:ATP-dependent DNA helicase n=1 Tax=Caballeronia sp. LZ034LL TaxID=3038567 RepID=UPI00285D32CF|nr:AAA family ATPase [Caballeronia sp. LZ034LL]MDR5839301.1 AAA family ATPase [Caballeronia sp. LZ034LL]